MISHYSLPLYGINLDIVYTDSVSQTLVGMGVTDKPESVDYTAMTMQRENSTIVIILTQEQPSDMFHEAVHAALYIARMRGLDIDLSTNNEHIAYLTGWIGEMILKSRRIYRGLLAELKALEATATKVEAPVPASQAPTKMTKEVVADKIVVK